MIHKVQFKYGVGFGRMKIKGVVIFPAIFSNGGFIGFLISNTEIVFM